jgi:hypothetical protein
VSQVYLHRYSPGVLLTRTSSFEYLNQSRLTEKYISLSHLIRIDRFDGHLIFEGLSVDFSSYQNLLEDLMILIDFKGCNRILIVGNRSSKFL